MIPYGAAYYPEHWPRDRWETDARMMAELGFNVVRVGEFAWSRFEPRPGHLDLDWMDEVVETLYRRGIKCVMGTPTGGVPPWFTAAHPDSLIIDARGRRAGSVNRYFTCFNHKPFLEASRKIVEAMAAKWGGDKRVIGWHLHNELGGNRCYCDRCRAAFQVWLKDRYGSLKELNRRWGTIFWSHVYNDWEEIPVPLETHHNAAPALDLAWKRWYIDLITDYAKAQADVIRAKSKDQWISTNLDPHDNRVFEILDRPGYNFYPHTWDDGNDARNSMTLDAMRPPSAKMNPFSFEQRGGQPGWDLVSRLNRPGEQRLLAWQAFAHGADGMTYFRWRIAWFGHENLWGGIVRHDGTLHPHVAPAAAQIAQELRRVGPIMEGGRVESTVAILRTQDCAWALERQPQQERLTYDGLLCDWYRGAVRYGVNVDVVEAREALERYRVIVAPAHYIMTPALAERLQKFVEHGGVLISTFRTAVVDEDVAVPEQESPAWLSDCFGVRVEAYDVQEISRYHTNPAMPPGRIRITDPSLGGGTAQAHSWYDLLSLRAGAKPLAVYAAGFYRGTPAIAERRLGRGRAIYVGCGVEQRVVNAIVARACRVAGVKPLARVPEGVEVRERTVHRGVLRFLLNFTTSTKRAVVGPGFMDAMTGKRAGNAVRLPPYGVVVLHRMDRKAPARP